jgi:hypothetical protein
MKIENTSGFAPEQIETFPAFGTFRNKWRGRVVTVRQHPSDHLKVVSVGVGEAETVICTESISAYATRITNHDWSDYT